MLTPHYPLFTIDVFKLYGFHADLVADVVDILSVDTVWRFDEIFMKKSFDSFYSYE